MDNNSEITRCDDEFEEIDEYKSMLSAEEILINTDISREMDFMHPDKKKSLQQIIREGKEKNGQ